MTHMKRIPARSGLLAALLAGAMTVTAPALAQQGSGGAEQSGGQAAQQQSGKDLMASRAKVRKLRKELGDIRTSALENNPELKDKRKELEKSVNEQMRANGVDPDKDMKRLREIAKKLRSGDVKGEEQKALTQEYREKRQAMLKARRKALSNEEIQKRRKAFQDQLLTAMKSENPKTDQLIKKYNKARMDMRQQMRKSFSKQKGGQGQSDGGASSQ